MNKKSSRATSYILIVLPLVIVIAIMTPRLISPQFGLLDDGTMLLKVKEILDGDLSFQDDLQAGRFRPLYWLYFAVIYAGAGMKPFWFFFSHLLLFLILLIQIRSLLKKMNATDWQILLASLLFIFSIPVVENFYTLSKGEVLQLVFLLAALLCLERLKQKHKAHWMNGVSSFLCILAAILVKETAIIMTLVGGAWALYVLLKKEQFAKQEQTAHLVFFASAVAAAIVFFFLREIWGAAPLTGGNYTERYTFSIQLILVKATRWITLLAQYFHYLIPLAIIGLSCLFRNQSNNPHRLKRSFDWSIWSSFWVISLIPWGYAEAYYLLPLSLGISVLVGHAMPGVLETLRNSPKPLRYFLIGLSIVSGLLFLATLPNYRTHALTQLAIDRANHQMLMDAVELTPRNGRVFIGLDKENEYVQNIRYFLQEHLGRADITLDYLSVETLETLHWYSDSIVIIPYVSNLPNLIPRTGVDEYFTMTWADIILHTMEGRQTGLRERHYDFRLSNLNLPVIACPIVGERGFCTDPDPILDLRPFSYGWDFYQVN